LESIQIVFAYFHAEKISRYKFVGKEESKDITTKTIQTQARSPGEERTQELFGGLFDATFCHFCSST